MTYILLSSDFALYLDFRMADHHTYDFHLQDTVTETGLFIYVVQCDPAMPPYILNTI